MATLTAVIKLVLLFLTDESRFLEPSIFRTSGPNNSNQTLLPLLNPTFYFYPSRFSPSYRTSFSMKFIFVFPEVSKNGHPTLVHYYCISLQLFSSYLLSVFELIFVLPSLATKRSILCQAQKCDKHYQNHQGFVHLNSKRIDFCAFSVAFLVLPKGSDRVL